MRALQSKFYGREVIVATREMVEQGSDEFLEEAKESDVALVSARRVGRSQWQRLVRSSCGVAAASILRRCPTRCGCS